VELRRVIKDLYKERAKLDSLIVRLELQCAAADAREKKPPKRRPGRTTMGAEERRKVSERMKKYWATYRGGRREPLV